MIDEIFMKQAISLAEQTKSGGNYPFGAVIVRDGKVVSSGQSDELSENDVTKHAELQAVSMACQTLGTTDLSDCTLYASGEPCNMCASSAFQADISRVVIGATRNDLSNFFRKRAVGIKELAKDTGYKVDIVTGVLKQEAIILFDGVVKR